MIVGLTGGIGSGKSTVLKMFQKLGAQSFIADIEAKKIMNSDEELVLNIKQVFGDEAYKNGELNRAYIAEKVFNNKEKLNKLNALVHPKVRAYFNNFSKGKEKEIIIYEAAILFESGSDKICNYVITITADLEERIKRIQKRDRISKEQIQARINNQISDAERVSKSDFVIENNNLIATQEQVNTVFELLLKLNKD
ncbi:dephospho-CoA kinase [Lutibacter sp. TH_r2]|uniref:dephospho-CoA kinase n=1 Tax=Lutibacter sp. TH_r2 TaxID=3082083 RepID=UPI0029530733|nr:dephospho-CoA kinase [Lutibacter sp. TH_r2]MDV7188115.1 dephospho-CoA kinase [Lutibacter sp. TH_r2]